MPGPYPLPTLSVTITPNGPTAPSYADILASLQASYQNIYGSDVDLSDDTQDGQWLAVLAFYFNACNASILLAYSSYSPTTATGAALSSNVKINGIERDVATNSTVVVTLTGVAGTTITNGSVGDTNENVWNLPATVVISDTGTIEVTATAANVGAITALPGTVTNILTPTRGWQSVTNAAAAEPGAPVQTDPQLRALQAISTSQPATSTLAAIEGAVANVTGVTACRGYENDSSAVDGNGAPAHSVYIVATGGSVQSIVNAIGGRTMGQPTYGTTSGTFTDTNGNTKTVDFFETTQERVVVNITVQAQLGYLASTGAAILSAMSAAVAALNIGDNVEYFGTLASAAILSNPTLAATYNVSSITACLFGGTPAAGDVTIPFNGQAGLAVTDVDLIVIPA